MLELDCGLEFFADFAPDFFAAMPARPGIFLLEMKGAGAQPYLARTADIRRAAERLLGSPEAASKQLNLREVAARIRYRVTGSKFEQNLAFYQNARLYFPSRFRELMRLRPPAMLKVNLRNSYFQFPFNSASRQSRPFPPFVSGGHSLILVVAIGLLIVLGIVLGIALLYVSSRMRFVLFDSVVEGECRIRDFWNRRGVPALRYFVWQILLTVAGLASFVLLIGIPLAAVFSAGWLSSPREHIAPLVLCAVMVILLFLADIIALTVIHVLTKDFVVPQMALDNTTPLEGWRRLLPMMEQEKGAYAGYIGMKLVLSIASGILLGIITLIALGIVFLPIGGAGVLAFLWARNAGIAWTPVTIAITIVAGALALLVIVTIGALISVPAIVFFPAYSMHFFAERYPALQALLYPPQASPTKSN